MIGQSNLKNFNEIYDETYFDVLKFILIKCHNTNDVNDILQETYLEFWKILNKKEIENTNIKSYLMGIALNKLKKHYSILYRLNTISIFKKDENDNELIDVISSDFSVEDLIIKEDEWERLWEYIKNKKDQNIPKIFYLYYKLEMSIKDISKELNKSESYIKNSIYRTLKELNSFFEKENDEYDK